MTCSEASSICAAMETCGIPDVSARTAGSTRTGSAAGSLLSLAKNLSASSWRAESEARSSGDAPKRISPLPGQFQRALIRAVGHFERFEPRGRIVALTREVTRQDGGERRSRTLWAGRARQYHRAFEARRPRVERQHAVEIGRERLSAGIDFQMDAGAVAVGGLAGRNPERIARARQHEIAVAADRAGQRTHVAGKGDVIELERRAAGGVMQRDPAGEIEAIDRQRTQIDRTRVAGQSIRPFGSRPRSSDRPLMVSSVARTSPRIERTQAEFDVELSARTLPRSLAPPTATERSCNDGAGSSRASSLPLTRTGAPMIRLASASNCGRN